MIPQSEVLRGGSMPLFLLSLWSPLPSLHLLVNLFSSSLSLYPCVPPLHAPSLSPSLFPPSLFFSLRHGPPLSFPLAFISFVFPFPLGPQLHAPLVPLAAAQLCRGVTCSLLLCPQVHCPRGHCPRGHPQTAQPWDAPPEINACCCLALSPS